jgi:hypothetical protein
MNLRLKRTFIISENIRVPRAHTHKYKNTMYYFCIKVDITRVCVLLPAFLQRVSFALQLYYYFHLAIYFILL